MDSFIAAARAAIGQSHVLTAPEDRTPYEADFWHQHSGTAIAVLCPADTAEVAALVRLAAAHGVPLVPQGGNTGLVAGGIPDKDGTSAILSLRRLDRIRHVDPAGDHMVVEAGCILATIQATAEEQGRLFPLTLGAEGSCQIGGNIATNAGGNNVLRYGMTRNLVLGLEVVLPDGAVLDLLRPLHKDNTGYDLKQIFIGSEGTLGIITAAVIRLVAAPRERVTLWVAIDTLEASVTLFRAFRNAFGDLISAFELLSSPGVELALERIPDLRRPVADPAPWHLLIDIAWTFDTGLRERVESELEHLFEAGLCRDGAVADSEAQRRMMWRVREGQTEAAMSVGDVVRSDVAVAVSDIPALVTRMDARVPDIAPSARLLPFGHVGDGNLHMNFAVPRDMPEAEKHALLDALFEEVDRLGGSISAEHAVGRLKREAIAIRKAGPALDLLHRIKHSLDPAGLMNPGVVLHPDPSPPA